MKITIKKKLAVLGFALYLTFILLSIVPYIAQNEIDGVKDQMDEKYSYYLEFSEDGQSSHYIILRENNTKNGTIQLTYITSTHILNVETKNIKTLVIDCKAIYLDESMKVFKESPLDNEILYEEYFTEEREEFKIIFKTDTALDELRFSNSPEPVNVIVNDEEWWKGGEGEYWAYEGNDIVIYNIESGTYDVTINFKLKLPPKAFFEFEGTNIEEVGKIWYGFVNKEIIFNGSDSHDKLDGGSIKSYDWDFGDDNFGTNMITTHTYTQTGTFNIILEVTDDRGLKGNTTKEIIIIISSKDKDMDGMDDSWEKIVGLDTGRDDSQEDPDEDNLINLNEFKYKTSPFTADTDGDKFSDYDEIMVYNTNASDINDIPTIKESDGDDEGEDNLGLILGVVAAIIIVIIFLVLFLNIRKRKKEEEPTEVEEIEGAGEEEEEEESEEEEAEEEEESEEEEEEPEEEEEESEEGKIADKKKPPKKLKEQPGGEIPVRGPPKKKKGKKSKQKEETKPEEGESDEVVDEDSMGLIPPPDEEISLEDQLSMLGPEEGASTDDLASEMESMKMPMDDHDLSLGGDLPPPPPDSEMTLDIDTSGLDLDISSLDTSGLSGKSLETGLDQSGLVGEAAPGPSAEELEAQAELSPEAEGELTVKDYVKKGALLFKDKKYSEAIVEWQKALDIEPDHPEIVESIKEAMTKMKQNQ